MIDHDICAALFRPARPVQHLTSAAGLLDVTLVSAKVRAQREAAAQRAARALIGLLAAAIAFLGDLRLVRRVPGGVLVLPAAARYRNIKLALPVTQSGDS